MECGQVYALIPLDESCPPARPCAKAAAWRGGLARPASKPERSRSWSRACVSEHPKISAYRPIAATLRRPRSADQLIALF
jgi:hypothetical protein